MSAASPIKLAILISGRGSNMQALADACASGTLAARVAVVIAGRSVWRRSAQPSSVGA